ncbi:MAG TPA: hypothetical protein VFB73_18195 [Chloroflexota bacterium]|nr:hypothetical protein [Chloroflexota bacterium]
MRPNALIALMVAAMPLLPAAPAAAQAGPTDTTTSPRPECQTAQLLFQRLVPRERQEGGLAPTGWALPPYPWVAGFLPYPYPYVPTGWRRPPSAPEAALARALRQLVEFACAPAVDTQLAQQYADLVNLLGYLQGDVADALEQPAREILASAESPRVRELAAAILAAIATLRRGGPP